ncbi:MAG: asparagine synthase (glutamine-hydrolyzing) [Elusimicrobia bacterium]|nr:asparagine synthase (glutamine-hydrolyzing) [Elusimicrobiota bacterium]
MCGIFGALGLELSALGVKDALQSLRHRGPDDWGAWSSDWSGRAASELCPDLSAPPWAPGNMSEEFWRGFSPKDVALGHARLSILDLTRDSRQPMAEEEGVALVFNGEIYNYIELRSELVSAGWKFRSRGDTEVLLKSYLAWGPACVSRFNGFFAFAVWDGRKKTLFAARDRLGKKPFYYCRPSAESLVFASEIKAFWAVRAVEPAVRRDVAARFLALGALPKEDESLFEGIWQLPAASILLWSPGQTPRIERYWAPEVSFDRKPERAEESLRELLFDSVRLRFRSDVPVGVALSGGVDSASLLAASVDVRKAGGVGELRALSAAHHEERFSEGKRVRQTLSAYPEVAHEFFSTSQLNSYGDFLEFLRSQDEPLKFDGVFSQYRFMRQASAAGFKVLLSGQGADELFAGYPWYIRVYAAWLLRRGKVFQAWPWLKELKTRQYGSWPGLLGDLGSDLLMSRGKSYKHRRVLRWLSRDAWASHCLEPYERELRLSQDWPAYHASQIFQASLPGLLKDEDRNSMGSGIETRLPYLDHRLVEWALSLDPSFMFRGGATKHLLRSAFASRLPEDVAWSKEKRGFYVPCANQWPEHKAEFKRLMEGASWASSFVDVPGYAKLWESGQIDEQLAWRFFSLLFASENAEKSFASARPNSPPSAAVRASARFAILLPTVVKPPALGGGYLNTVRFGRLLARHAEVRFVSYKAKEEGTWFLPEAEERLIRDRYVMVLLWGQDVAAHVRCYHGKAPLVYYHKGIDFNVHLEPDMPILCNSRYLMTHAQENWPANPAFYMPPVLEPHCRDAGRPRDIDVLVVCRKQPGYIFKELVPRLKARCRVEVLDEFLDRERLFELFNRAKVYLYAYAPQRTDYSSTGWRMMEGFGTQALEAMVCGCAVFSNLRGGMADFVDPEVNAFRLESHSADWDACRILKAVQAYPPQGGRRRADFLLEHYGEDAFHERAEAFADFMADYVPFCERHPARPADFGFPAPMSRLERIAERTARELYSFKRRHLGEYPLRKIADFWK